MLYATINANGVAELRQDSSETGPDGAVELTYEQHTDLMAMNSDDRLAAVQQMLQQ